MAAAPPQDADAASPLTRVVFAVAALLLFRWSVYGPVSMATTAETRAREKLRTLIAVSQAAVRDKRYEEALLPLEQLTRLQPKNHVYWWERAAVAGAMGRPADEIAALEQFVKVSPLPGEACPRLGFLYQENGQIAEARDAFKRCAAFSPNDLEDAFYYGYSLERNGQVDEALQVYAGALEHGVNADDEAGLGRMLLRKGKPAAAYKAAVPALDRNPNNGDALLVVGIALSRQGKKDEARVLLERGAARHDDTDYEYALGALDEMQGKPRQAVAHYEAALRFSPDNKDAQNRRARLARFASPSE
jgi:tetratricopeptide (TPR) repeat protein